jgi:hypothetical protein
MAHPLSGHLINASALALAAVVGLAADRYSIGPAGSTISPRTAAGLGDAAAYFGTSTQEALLSRQEVPLRLDPFRTGDASDAGNSVAYSPNSSTVNAGAAVRRLTAILVANDKPVAVVNDEVVGVGDVLRDGARVSRIQSDRVFLVEKNGKWRTLTLAGGRP